MKAQNKNKHNFQNKTESKKILKSFFKETSIRPVAVSVQLICVEDDVFVQIFICILKVIIKDSRQAFLYNILIYISTI